MCFELFYNFISLSFPSQDSQVASSDQSEPSSFLKQISNKILVIFQFSGSKRLQKVVFRGFQVPKNFSYIFYELQTILSRLKHWKFLILHFEIFKAPYLDIQVHSEEHALLSTQFFKNVPNIKDFLQYGRRMSYL